MHPVIAAQNLPNSALADAKTLRHVPLEHAAGGQSADFSHPVIGELGVAMTLASWPFLYRADHQPSSKFGLAPCPTGVSALRIRNEATALSPHVSMVVGRGSKKQVPDLYACAVVAMVADKEASWDWPDEYFPCGTVGVSTLSSDCEGRSPRNTTRVVPLVAAVFSGRPEPIESPNHLRLSFFHFDYVDHDSRSRKEVV